MDYTLMPPSLKERALTKIAITLWNHDYARHLAASMVYFIPSPNNEFIDKKERWLKVENEVIEMAEKLPLPRILKKELSSYIAAVGWEYLLWMEFHRNRCDVVSKVPDSFSWTPQGTIDKARTAMMIVEDEELDIGKRYKLACLYCLEDHIRALWVKVNIEKGCRAHVLMNFNNLTMVSFWNRYMEDKLEYTDPVMRRCCMCDSFSPHEYAFRHAVASGNEAAVKFFFEKLTVEGRERLLVRTTQEMLNVHKGLTNHTNFPKEHYSNVLCYLLMGMSKEQQMELFRSSCLHVLTCLLDWPWQSSFIKTAEMTWHLLPVEDFYQLLNHITNKLRRGFKDYDYQQLFTEFWQLSPRSYKKVVATRFSKGPLLSNLFELRDQWNIASILQELTATEREEYILSVRGKAICTKLIMEKEDWEMLSFLLVQCISSEEAALKLTESFKTSVTCFHPRGNSLMRGYLLGQFFCMLDSYVGKHNSEESLSGGVKRPATGVCDPDSEDVFRCVENLVEMCEKQCMQ